MYVGGNTGNLPSNKERGALTQKEMRDSSRYRKIDPENTNHMKRSAPHNQNTQHPQSVRTHSIIKMFLFLIDRGRGGVLFFVVCCCGTKISCYYKHNNTICLCIYHYAVITQRTSYFCDTAIDNILILCYTQYRLLIPILYITTL